MAMISVSQPMRCMFRSTISVRISRNRRKYDLGDTHALSKEEGSPLIISHILAPMIEIYFKTLEEQDIMHEYKNLDSHNIVLHFEKWRAKKDSMLCLMMLNNDPYSF
jgi:hypothetical protein